jgi:hypothetical protein
MLSVSVYVLGDKGRTVATINHATENSSQIKVRFCKSTAEIVQAVKNDKSDLIHFVPSGAVILPNFYEAMLNYIEHSQRDYVFCPCLKIDGDTKTLEELRPEDKQFSHGQMIVRSWVVNELGAEVADLGKLSRRVVNEYRGVEIPHHLYMEM